MLAIGDKVKIIRSPYISVKNGRTATVKNIMHERYGKYWTMYVLDTKPCSTFRIHELEKVEKPVTDEEVEKWQI